jgi:hypothetical protein
MADESLEGFRLAGHESARKFGFARLVHATIVTCFGGCGRRSMISPQRRRDAEKKG